MPKSTKRFILNTEKVNKHSFRIITSGIDLTDFRANPIMYWMHVYPTGEKRDELLPIGFWDDIQINGNVLSAVPNFDDKDEFAMTIYNKVEHGTIRAASVGISPVEISSDPADMMPGQTLPTYIRSTLAEASVVDRGSNTEAVTLNISADMLTMLNQLAVKNKQQSSLSNNNNNPLDPDGVHSPETLAIVENALKVKKIDREFAGQLLGLGTEKSSIDTIKHAIRNIPIDIEKLQGHYHHTLLESAGKPYDQLKNREPAGRLMDLRDHAPDLYRAKYFEGNGKMPYELNGKLL